MSNRAKRNPLDLTGETVRANIRQRREDQNLTYAQLSRKLAELGRKIPDLGLRRIEEGNRRVDVDDLLALARALKTTPITLLMPVDDHDPVAAVAVTGFGDKIGPGELWLWLSAHPSGGAAVGQSPAEFIANTLPPWKQFHNLQWRVVQDGGPDHGDN
jgi:transcriptional regulator with XRE-family HTH domain